MIGYLEFILVKQRGDEQLPCNFLHYLWTFCVHLRERICGGQKGFNTHIHTLRTVTCECRYLTSKQYYPCKGKNSTAALSLLLWDRPAWTASASALTWCTLNFLSLIPSLTFNIIVRHQPVLCSDTNTSFSLKATDLATVALKDTAYCTSLVDRDDGAESERIYHPRDFLPFLNTSDFC